MNEWKLVVIPHSGALPGLGGIGGPVTTPTELRVDKIVKLLQQNIKVLECDPADRMNTDKRVRLNLLNVKMDYATNYAAKKKADEYAERIRNLPKRAMEDLEKRIAEEEAASTKEAQKLALENDQAELEAGLNTRVPNVQTVIEGPNGEPLRVNSMESLEDMANATASEATTEPIPEATESIPETLVENVEPEAVKDASTSMEEVEGEVNDAAEIPVEETAPEKVQPSNVPVKNAGSQKKDKNKNGKNKNK